MPYNFFRPKSGRFGVHPAVIQFQFPATPFTVNTTVTYQIPTPPGRLSYLRAAMQCTTVGADADGTMVARIFRRQASDDVRTQLNADFNVEGLVTRERKQLVIATGLKDAQRVVKDPGTGSGDTIEVDLVSNSAAIETQPTNLMISIEMAYEE